MSLESPGLGLLLGSRADRILKGHITGVLGSGGNMSASLNCIKGVIYRGVS